MENNIKQHAIDRIANIAGSFVSDNISKGEVKSAISQEDFELKYGDHEIYAAEGVEKYRADALEKGVESELIEGSIADLHEVLVKGESDSIVKFYVKEKETTEEV